MSGVNIVITYDQTAPVLQIPSNTTIACGESLEPTSTGEAAATDAGWGVLLLTYTDTFTVVYSNFDRIVQRKWTAEDYCTNSVTATQTIHQALCDLDADGLPDEWEQQIVDFDLMDGITNFYDVVSTNDFDEDGLTNGEEFELGTDPTALDTDLDWAGDAYEVAEETDPTDYSSTPALRMIINDNDLYTESTWLSLSFPGLVADTMNVSESWDMSNSTVAVKSEPTTFILPSDSNGLRKVYVKLVRAFDGQLSPRLMSSIRLDTEPPAVEVVSPTNDWRTSRRWIFIEGTATDTVSGVRVLVNDEYVDGMADCEFQHNRLHLEEGTNLIAVVGTDAAGNAATQTVSVIQDFSDDTNAPIFTMNLPLDYEVSGGVTNWLDTTTYGSNEVLFLNGGIDDETAEIQFLVIGVDVTNGPFAGRAAGTQLWGRVELLPGTNSLIVLADDAAGNVATGTYTIVRNTSMVFEITYPAAYQTLNASSVTVYGVASPFFSNAVISVNGIACSITDNGSNITFATVEPVPLNAGRNSISGMAEVNGRVYYTDPEHFGYEILKYRAQYDDFWDDDWDGDPPVMLRYLYTWDNQTQLYIDERYEDGVLARHTETFKPNLDWESGDAYCDFGEGTWDHYNLSSYALRHIDYNYKSRLHFTKHWPTQEVQMVIFQFIDLEYERAPGVEIDPSLITYRGQTGFWYNGHVSFIVPIKTDTEYVIKQEDFMIGKKYGWPYHNYEIGPYTTGIYSTVYLQHSFGHQLGFRYFTNDILNVHIDIDEKWVIPAKSTWPDAPSALSQLSDVNITITTDPSGFEDTISLIISKVLPEEPATGSGTLTRDNIDLSLWLYESFTESQTEKHPVPKQIIFTASIDDTQCATEHLTVCPIFRHLSAPMLGIYTQDRENAWKYARWKYSIDTSDLDSITYNDSLGDRGQTTSYVLGGNFCELGPAAFDDENLCASTLGHENVHGGQEYLFRQLYSDCAEAEAYLWELNHADTTGISSIDIGDIQNNYNYFSSQCDP